jgi:hypothetical protein
MQKEFRSKAKFVGNTYKLPATSVVVMNLADLITVSAE